MCSGYGVLNIKRRGILVRLAAVCATATDGVSLPFWAQAPKTVKLRIVIPVIARGSLNYAKRALGDLLTIAGVCDEVEYENRDGRGGTVGLAYYAHKYSRDPNTLLMGDRSLVGAIALYKPVVDLNRVLP